jgi:short subunit dehydrogenase-like uncharacterized protein
MSTWMIYGANGCMGKKLVEEALRRGEAPMLAGRSAHLMAWAREKQLPCRIFDVRTVQEILPFLQDIQIFVDCAGPYTSKSSAILVACCKKKIHYIDLSLEYRWSQRVFSFSSKFKKQGCWAVTSVSSYALLGEYLACSLKGKLPNTTSLDLTYASSHFPTTKGSSLTYLSILACGHKTRSNNRMTTQWVSSAYKAKEWATASGAFMGTVARRVALVDLVTVWVVTRIPFISTFVTFAPGDIHMVRAVCVMARFSFLHGILQRFLSVYAQSREVSAAPVKIRVSGRAENASGQHHSMQVELEGQETLSLQMVCDLVTKSFTPQKGTLTAGQRLGSSYLFASTDLETSMHHISYGEES